jgi:hypothetical protein
MLSLFLLHISITLFSLFSGFLFYHYIIRDNKTNSVYKPVFFYLITGLIAITTVLQLIVLFAPIKGYVQVLFLLAFFLLCILARGPLVIFTSYIRNEIKNQPTLAIITFFIAWLLLLLLNAGPTQMDDTESYHLQSIKWIKEYGSVPGLVHLHQRFAFNSSWFSTIAFFNVPAGHLNYYTSLNGSVSLWLTAYFIRLMSRKDNNLFIIGLFLFLIGLLSWPLIRGNATNTNYDSITNVIILILFIETARTSHLTRKIVIHPEWMIWPAYLFTVRITNAPFLLLTVFAFFNLLRQKEYRRLLTYVLICLLLTITFLARNVILSGYLLYPSLSFDWFTVDWKADPVKTKELLRFIKYFNRVNTGIQPLEKTESLAFFDWIKTWFHYMFSFDKIIFIPGFLGLLLFPFMIKKITWFQSPVVKLFIAAIALQIITWFMIAPDPRFIYGCLLIGIVILAVSFVHFLPDQLLLRLFFPSLVLILTTTTGFVVSKILTTKSFPGRVYPYSLPTPPLQTISIGNIELYVPDKILNNWNPRCYDTKLPCLYEIEPGLQPRGATIADGFKIKK